MAEESDDLSCGTRLNKGQLTCARWEGHAWCHSLPPRLNVTRCRMAEKNGKWILEESMSHTMLTRSSMLSNLFDVDHVSVLLHPPYLTSSRMSPLAPQYWTKQLPRVIAASLSSPCAHQGLMVEDGIQRKFVVKFSPWGSVVVKCLKWFLELISERRKLS